MSNTATMKWERYYGFELIQAIFSEEKFFDEVWRYENAKVQATCLVDNLPTYNNFGKMRHMTIKKVDKAKVEQQGITAWIFSDEPNYAEKLSALKNVGQWKKFGLEVFPTEEKLVDQANLYHVWEVENSNVLPFELNPIFDVPEEFEEVSGKDYDVQYALRVCNTRYGKIAYMYLKSKDGKELRWKQKQHIKNEIVGDETALEVIFDKAKKLPYTCLVCLPMGYNLEFGL